MKKLRNLNKINLGEITRKFQEKNVKDFYDLFIYITLTVLVITYLI